VSETRWPLEKALSTSALNTHHSTLNIQAFGYSNFIYSAEKAESCRLALLPLPLPLSLLSA